MWRFTSGAAAMVVISGALPWRQAGDVVDRMAPILVFLVAITVVAELADSARVFDVAAREAAHLAAGRTWCLFALVCVLAAGTTILLGLDTTAVLLTPVVLAVADQLRISPLPFAMITVWLANTASLLLPVSNLTNLLALHELGLPPHAFAARMWLPTLVSVVGTALVVAVAYRRQLRGSYVVPPHPPVEDRPLFLCTASTCVALVPALLLGGDPTVVVVVGAAVLLGLFAYRRRDALRPGLLPWRLVLLVLGLALVIEALQRHGGEHLVLQLMGSGADLPDLLRVAGSGALASNVGNNLPAYLALEPGAHQGTSRLLALLVGTNVGPLVLVWGSLATLLWRERCRARGVDVSPWVFARLGLLGVPPLLVCTTVGLWLS
jgi:arsenical pump membrane protein